MTSQPEIAADDDWLDARLRDAGREHRADYLADDGFTERVMSQLPAAATLPAWRRPAIVLLWLLALGAGVLSAPDLFDQLFRSALAVLAAHRFGLSDIAMMLVAAAGATWGALIYAIRSE